MGKLGSYLFFFLVALSSPFEAHVGLVVRLHDEGGGPDVFVVVREVLLLHVALSDVHGRRFALFLTQDSQEMYSDVPRLVGNSPQSFSAQLMLHCVTDLSVLGVLYPQDYPSRSVAASGCVYLTEAGDGPWLPWTVVLVIQTLSSTGEPDTTIHWINQTLSTTGE